VKNWFQDYLKTFPVNQENTKSRSGSANWQGETAIFSGIGLECWHHTLRQLETTKLPGAYARERAEM